MDGGKNASVNEGDKKISFWKTVFSCFQDKTILF